MQIISIEQWAQDNKVSTRKAYRWAKSGKLPLRKRKITVNGVPANITVMDIVNAE